MSLRLVDVDPRQYLVADDFASVYQAMVTGSLVEDASGAPVDRGVTIVADIPGVTARAVDGGFFVAAGYPNQIALPATLTLTFSAPGFDAVSHGIVIGANAALPIDAGVVRLSRKPIRLQGRVLNALTRAPIAGAVVTVVSPNIAALRTPLHFDHTSGIAVNQRALNGFVAPTQLSGITPAGSLAINVASTAGMGAGSVLTLGPDRDIECVIVASLGPGASQVNLTAPLRRTFAAGAAVQVVTPGASGATQNLSRAAKAGDGLLRLSGPLAADTFEIADPAALEYGFIGAVSDAQGFYGLDAIGGVASLDLNAAAAGFNSSQVTYSVDYERPVNVVDFRLA